MREHTLYDIAVKHALDTRGKEARAEMDAALLRLAADLEADARKSERVVTVAGTVGFVLISVFILHAVSGLLDATALLAPAFANAIFGLRSWLVLSHMSVGVGRID